MHVTESPLSLWIQQHGREFVAHATTNYDCVFKSGIISCAEAVLKSTGSCEHEGRNVGGRKITTSPVVPMQTAIMIVFEIFSKKTGKPVTITLIPKYAKKMLGPHLTEEHPPKDYGRFWKCKESGHDWHIRSQRDLVQRDRTDAFKPFNRNINVINSDLEENNEANKCDPNEIDPTIRQMYRYCSRKNVCPDRLAHALRKFRGLTFDSFCKHMYSEIFVLKNRIAWSYGPIAFLIGHPVQKIMSQFFFETDRTYFSDNESHGKEYVLKQPFQVDDGFYEERMDISENLILGPKALLDPYREDPDIEPLIKRRFVDIESLAPEQRLLFNIDSKIKQNLVS